MSNLAPIVLFVYNRPWHTRQTIEALQKNKLASESDLFIYADGAKNMQDIDNVEEVRHYIQTISGFKSIKIIQREENWGLADNITDGVTTIVNKYGKIIVLEDDIVTSVFFLDYMNDVLNVYQEVEKVMHVSGYMYPFDNPNYSTVFINFVTPWGWGTWEKAWRHFEENTNILWNSLKLNSEKGLERFNKGFGNEFSNQLIQNLKGEINTWAVKWHSSIYLNDGFCIYPTKSLTRNIGFDNSGENCNVNNKFDTELSKKKIHVRKEKLIESETVLKQFKSFYITNFEINDIGNNGERLDLKSYEYWTYEHIHRYYIASLYVKEKTVIDIASGEGYGTYLLSKYSKKAIGFDINKKTVDYANMKYKRDNLSYKIGSITKIPIADKSVDIVVSFETIEHINEHDNALKEIRRILKENGILIMSSPEKINYNYELKEKNKFHIKELTFNEYKKLISKYFTNYKFQYQKSIWGSIIQNNNLNSNLEFLEGTENRIDRFNSLLNPTYIICFAGNIDNIYFKDTLFLDNASSLIRKNYQLEKDISKLKQELYSIYNSKRHRFISFLIKIILFWKK